MRFDDDDIEESGTGLPVVYMALGVSVFIFLVLFLVIALNNTKKKTSDISDYFVNATPTSMAEQEIIPSGEKRVASDLDIWDMYPTHPVKDEDDEEEQKPTITPIPTVSPEVTPDYDDDKHIKITFADGSEEWIAINDKWKKNNYDFTNLVNSGGILKYMSDGRNISFAGIDVSRYQKEIDYTRVKAQGIDFVMIRVGQRGYKNGEITQDEYFESNFTKALEAGLDVGLYFYSQATTVDEAVEEAQFVINAINGRNVKYPVAIDMEFVSNDSARIDTLTKEEKTTVSAAFANKIKEAGYRPMIYGNKEWLLKRIDVSKFDQSSIWLSQKEDYPDYPYEFDMWQYSTEGELYGIDGPVDLNICFVDYAAQ